MSIYTKEIKEFAKTKMEQIDNNTTIAKEICTSFQLDVPVEQVRRWVSKYRARLKIKAKKSPIKRLFFDIETSYYVVRSWNIGKARWIDPAMMIAEKQIICISYKWQYEEEVHTLDWSMGEKNMLTKFVKVLNQADEIIAHNGDNFDMKELRTRCIRYGVQIYPNYRTLDTLKKSREYFRFPSNKLDYIGKYLSVGRKLDHEGMQLWIDIVENKSKEKLKLMIAYCEQDVILLEDVYTVLSPYITHNNNFAVLTGGEKWDCPECGSSDVVMDKTYATPTGIVRRNMTCNKCKKHYRISNKSYMNMLKHAMFNDN